MLVAAEVVLGLHPEQEVLHLHQHQALRLVPVMQEILDHSPHRVEITQTLIEVAAVVDRALRLVTMVAQVVLVLPCFVGHLLIHKIKFLFLRTQVNSKYLMV
jgi:hypothetical protein